MMPTWRGVEEGGWWSVKRHGWPSVSCSDLHGGASIRHSGTNYRQGVKYEANKQVSVHEKYLLRFEDVTANRRVCTLDSLGLDQLLNLNNSTRKDVLLGLLVLDRLQDVLDYGLCECSLLFLLGLLLVTNPRVQNGFKL